MKRVALAAVVAGLAFAAAAPAWAQDQPPPPPEEQAPPPEAHREGVYGGVDPIDPADANKVKHKDAAARKTLHWVGFHQERGATEVFLQAADPFTVEQHVEGGALVVSLGGLTRLGKNVRRPLDTRFFDGPIVRIATRPRKARGARRGHPAVAAGIDVVITFRDGKPTAGDLRTATEADGMYYAYLTFAGGSGDAPPAEPPPPAPASQPSD